MLLASLLYTITAKTLEAYPRTFRSVKVNPHDAILLKETNDTAVGLTLLWKPCFLEQCCIVCITLYTGKILG